jgi:hypothetical protein
MSPTAEAARERDRNLLFLTTPALWPFWPLLPLVRRRPGAEEECGLLYDALHRSGTAGYAAAVILCNIFRLPRTEEELLALPREVYDRPEELFEAGWRVE